MSEVYGGQRLCKCCGTVLFMKGALLCGDCSADMLARAYGTTPPASQESAGEAVESRRTLAFLKQDERHNTAAESRYWCNQYRLYAEQADQTLATLTAELAEARAEAEKETAQSKHLAEAMSRKIQELIAAENQCSYYKGQYTRAEQVRKEACEANVKAQAKTLWLEDELAEAREQRDRLAQENLERAEAVIAQAANARNLADALKKLNNAARISGGVAGADKNLMDACENAERALSLAGTGRAVNAVLDVLEQRDSLRDECERLREDAERYQAIRDSGYYVPSLFCSPWALGGRMNQATAAELDAAADKYRAALSASGRDADGDGRGK